jgi:hypothetical protein
VALQEATAVQVNDDDVVPVVLSVLVVVDSSSFLHDTMITATLQIKTSKLIIFFIITSLHYRKMQDYSYIFVPGMVLTNTEITLHSHNTKQRRNSSVQYSP